MRKKKVRDFFIHEPLFEELKQEICYVCHKRIINEKDRLKIGDNIYRHKKCKLLRYKTILKS